MTSKRSFFAELIFVLALLYGSLNLVCGNHRRRFGKRHGGWGDYDYKEDYDEDEENNEIPIRHGERASRTLMNDGNFTMVQSCPERQCDGTWGAWQSWSECNVKLPGTVGPRCYNTLHHRKRFCAQDQICFESNWEFCLHIATCYGEWAPWSEYDGNCSTRCTNNQTRTRICYDRGVQAPGMCNESGSSAIQTEVIKCLKESCDNPALFSPTMKLALLIGSGFLLLVIIAAVAVTCSVMAYKRREPYETSLSSSSSFLLSHWRVISRRFTRKTHAKSQTGQQQHSSQHEVAIGSNCSAIHVYESPNDYAQVLDSAEENIYEDTPGEYRLPFSHMGEKSRSSTVTSEEKYAVIGPAEGYTSMEALGDLSGCGFREIRRVRSCDDVLMTDRNQNRSRHLPGAAVKAPMYRGASQFPPKKNTGLYKKPSNAGGVVARIAKRKVSRNTRPTLPNISLDFSLEEDRYGYLVSNSNGPNNRAPWQRQKTKTFGGFPKPASTVSMKSSSLPADIETYVTMKGPIDRTSCARDFR